MDDKTFAQIKAAVKEAARRLDQLKASERLPYDWGVRHNEYVTNLLVWAPQLVAEIEMLQRVARAAKRLSDTMAEFIETSPEAINEPWDELITELRRLGVLGDGMYGRRSP